MNSLKLYKWLLNNNCPWEFEPVITASYPDSITIEFTEKKEEDLYDYSKSS